QASGGWSSSYKYGTTKTNVTANLPFNTTLSGLAAGAKKYYVKDFEGCLDSTTVTVTEPNLIRLAISTLTNISCFNSKNGVAILSATGGNTTYIYKLTPASLTAQNFNSATITGLDAISYSATVTDEKNCTATTVSFTLTQPSPLIAGGNSTDASCGLPTGTAVITASGGVFPYAFQWLRNGSVTGLVTSSISGIYSGFYTANVLDANQCITPTQILVNDLSGPTVTGTALKGTVCWYDRTGTASVSAIAFGTKSITGFSWIGTLVTDALIGGLKGDTVYYVGARDNEGCFSSDTVYVPGPAQGQFSFTKADPTCHDGASGLLAITHVGGSPPYTGYLYTHTARRTLADSLVSVQSTAREYVFRNLTGFGRLNSFRNYRYA
ncbi:MAG: hypothetical protein K2Q22_06795, partial [Cytophagales bacterium]|nr:hypothetical protein [Cytophagales bacterium]